MDRGRRRYSGAFRWMRAAAFLAGAAAALSRAPFFPAPLRLAVAAGVAALGLLSPRIGVAAFVVALSLPLIAEDVIVGVAFLVVGLAAVRYLGGDGARPFVVVVLAFIASLLKLEWAVVAMAGYVLGASDGLVATLVACAVLEATGIVLGVPAMGATATGGGTAVLTLAEAPEGAVTFSWLPSSLRSADPAGAVAAFKSASPLPVLLLQPLVWAAGAGVAGTAARRLPGKAGAARVALAASAAAGGVVVVALGSMALRALGSPLAAGVLVPAALTSAAVAAFAGAALEGLFPPLPVPEPEAPPLTGIQAEDADVDELLRVIASAEEELAAKHTMEGAVLITDMKAFSAMTEEDGSVMSAKRIQRHRDLLLPVISAHGGHGKSTGGDGLVAAFDDPVAALHAAVDMQQTLDAYNETNSGDRAMLIRIGIGFGEVVLDRGGCPFIGSGLNKAARVMNLADGGQILACADVVAHAGRRAPATAPKGSYELKNIPGEVEVVEVPWEPAQRKAAGG
ncbi:MAG: adenylate/guanylate cyclase domain-containing protein [Coriobacteriia bacterium]|nr:adenylate/guanylate cyclase domain-containing protein [Coriobacteriia bacterium]